MSGRIRVRQATADDIPALVDLYVENHEFQRRGFPDRLRKTSAGWKQQGLPQAIAGLLARVDVAIFVAEADDRTVGLVDVYERHDYEVEGRPGRRYAEVQNLIVVEEYRRRGVGNQLMDTAEDWVRDRRIDEVELHTWEFPAGPLGFYEHRGYKTIERTLVLSLDAEDDS